MSGVLIAQLTFPTSEACAFLLKGMFAAEKTRDAAKLGACTDLSASKELHTRATLRDNAYLYVFDIETLVPSVCTTMVNDILKESPQNTMEVVSQCKAT